MADIVLMNKDGSPVGYSPVPSKIAVPGHDNDNKETTYEYTRFAAMKMYTLRGVTDSGWQVTHQILNLASNDYWFSGINENELKEYGNQNGGLWGVSFILTSKVLTVGNIYTNNELFG